MPSWKLRHGPHFARRAGLALLGSLGLCTLWSPEQARAGEPPELRVIVHPSNPLREADRELVAEFFLKKLTRWQHNEQVRPVDLRPDNPVRQRFSSTILKRSVGAVRSYWQQRIFSGRDVPPPELDSDAGVVAFVARSPGAIGYVSGSAKLVGVAELGIK